MKRFKDKEFNSDDFPVKETIGKIFLCENGLILFGRELYKDSLYSLDIIGKINDDINKYTYDDIIKYFFEPLEGKCMSECFLDEYEPSNEQILSKRFFYENENYWFFNEGELDDSVLTINELNSYINLKK